MTAPTEARPRLPLLDRAILAERSDRPQRAEE